MLLSLEFTVTEKEIPEIIKADEKHFWHVRKGSEVKTDFLPKVDREGVSGSDNTWISAPLMPKRFLEDNAMDIQIMIIMN